jgi:hypothetical protein
MKNPGAGPEVFHEEVPQLKRKKLNKLLKIRGCSKQV